MEKLVRAIAIALGLALLPFAGSAQPVDRQAEARAAIAEAWHTPFDETVIARALAAEANMSSWPDDLAQTYGSRDHVRALLFTLQAQAIVFRPQATPADIQNAIAIAQRALALTSVLTTDELARVHLIIGHGYRSHPSGDVERDDQAAMAAFEAGIGLGPRMTDQQLRGRIEIEMSDLLTWRRAGDRGQNITRAIELYAAGLSRFSGDQDLTVRAFGADRLGQLYTLRGQAGDLAASIAAYQQSLDLYARVPNSSALAATPHLHLGSAYFARANELPGPDADAAIAEAEFARAHSSPTVNRGTWLYATDLEVRAMNAGDGVQNLQRSLPLAIELADAWTSADDAQLLLSATRFAGMGLLFQQGSGMVANAQRAAAYFDRAISALDGGRISAEDMQHLRAFRDLALSQTPHAFAHAPEVNSCTDVARLWGAWLAAMRGNTPPDPSFAQAARRGISLCERPDANFGGDGARFFALSFLYFGLVTTETPPDWRLLDRALDYAQRALREPDIRSDPTALGQMNALIALMAAASQAHVQNASTLDLVRTSTSAAQASPFVDDRQGIVLAMLSATTNAESGNDAQARQDVDAGAAIVAQLIGAGLDEREILFAQRPARALYGVGAALAVRRGDAESAFGHVERSHAQVLDSILRSDEAALTPQDHARLIAVRADLRRREAEIDAAEHPTLQALDAIQNLRQQAADILGRARSSQVVQPATPVIVPIVSDIAGAILVRNHGAARIAPLNGVGEQDLEEALAAWKTHYRANDIASGIADFRARFERTLGVSIRQALQQAGIQAGARIALMPDGGMSLLPVALLRDANGRTLLDDYDVVLTPSQHALAVAEARAQTTSSGLVAFWNDTLRLANAETSLVATAFRQTRRTILDGASLSTPNQAFTALAGAGYWHFATHGAFDWTEPTRSGLILSARTTLTLADLLQSGQVLGRPRLIVLSACETGLSDVDHDPNEFIGLPAAFIESGGAGVIASLWPVEDSVTTLLFAKFYDLHLNGRLAPPQALRRAQLWLRDAPRDELQRTIDTAVANGVIDSDARTALQSALDDSEGDHPFNDPSYWGGWVYYGA